MWPYMIWLSISSWPSTFLTLPILASVLPTEHAWQTPPSWEFALSLHFIWSILLSVSSGLALPCLPALFLAQVSRSQCNLSCQSYLKSQLSAPALPILWLYFSPLSNTLYYFAYGLSPVTLLPRCNPAEGISCFIHWHISSAWNHARHIKYLLNYLLNR